MIRRINALSIMFGGLLLVFTGGAQAQTMSYADAMTVLAKDCGADVRKFCKSANLGNNEIQDCLGAHQSKVSPQCTATLSSVSLSIQKRLEAQASVFKICAESAAMHCKGVKGEVHILQCLIKTERIDSAKCNQVITDAGWR